MTDFSDDMWADVGNAYDADDAVRTAALARQAVLPLWHFVAAAINQEDFENRRALIAERLDTASDSLAGGDLAKRTAIRMEADRQIVTDYGTMVAARDDEAARVLAIRRAAKAQRTAAGNGAYDVMHGQGGGRGTGSWIERDTTPGFESAVRRTTHFESPDELHARLEEVEGNGRVVEQPQWNGQPIERRPKTGSKFAAAPTHVVVDNTDGMTFYNGGKGLFTSVEAAKEFADKRNADYKDGPGPYTVHALHEAARKTAVSDSDEGRRFADVVRHAHEKGKEDSPGDGSDPDLSGEWAGTPTGPEVFSDILSRAGVHEDDAQDYFTEALDSYERGYRGEPHVPPPAWRTGARIAATEMEHGSCAVCGGSTYRYPDTTPASFGKFNGGQDCWHSGNGPEQQGHYPKFVPRAGKTSAADGNYVIKRFYQDANKPAEVVKRGLTREQAQEHCKRDDTHGEGWFDGFDTEHNASRLPFAREAATPAWLHERVNDPYGTSNRVKDEATGEMVPHPFWAENPAEEYGGHKLIQRDGKTYAYNITQNAWSHHDSPGEAKAWIDRSKGTDVWASLHSATHIAADTPSCPQCGSGQVIFERSQGAGGDHGGQNFWDCTNCGKNFAAPNGEKQSSRVATTIYPLRVYDKGNDTDYTETEYEDLGEAQRAAQVAERAGHDYRSVPVRQKQSVLHTAASPVHTFGSTGEAYDRSQTDDNIKDGDLLHVPSEGVVGYLHAAWPIAVTQEHGAFHTLTDPVGGPQGEPPRVCQNCGGSGKNSPDSHNTFPNQPADDDRCWGCSGQGGSPGDPPERVAKWRSSWQQAKDMAGQSDYHVGSLHTAFSDQAHEGRPKAGTVKNSSGESCSGASKGDYPLSATCETCGKRITCADGTADWVHSKESSAHTAQSGYKVTTNNGQLVVSGYGMQFGPYNDREAAEASAAKLNGMPTLDEAMKTGNLRSPVAAQPGYQQDWDWEKHVGRGLLGFPGSEILAVKPGADYLMHGPMGGEAHGSVHVRLEDGREVHIPKDVSRIQSYERKTANARVAAPLVNCYHCGNAIEQRDDPTGQRTNAWADKNGFGDDRDFQCGVNRYGSQHEPEWTPALGETYRQTPKVSALPRYELRHPQYGRGSRFNDLGRARKELTQSNPPGEWSIYDRHEKREVGDDESGSGPRAGQSYMDFLQEQDRASRQGSLTPFEALLDDSIRREAGNPHPVGSMQWFEWEAQPHPKPGGGPYASDIPGGGIPLHGPLSPEQDAWLSRGRPNRHSTAAKGDECSGSGSFVKGDYGASEGGVRTNAAEKQAKCPECGTKVSVTPDTGGGYVWTHKKKSTLTPFSALVAKTEDDVAETDFEAPPQPVTTKPRQKPMPIEPPSTMQAGAAHNAPGDDPEDDEVDDNEDDPRYARLDPRRLLRRRSRRQRKATITAPGYYVTDGDVDVFGPFATPSEAAQHLRPNTIDVIEWRDPTQEWGTSYAKPFINPSGYSQGRGEIGFEQSYGGGMGYLGSVNAKAVNDKIATITASVLRTNPGMDARLARNIAIETVQKYPVVAVKQAAWGEDLAPIQNAALRSYCQDRWDDGDKWGSAMDCLGGIADVLTHLGEPVMSEIGYSPGMGGPDMGEDSSGAWFKEGLDAGQFDVDDLQQASQVLHALCDKLDAAGESY